MPHTIFPVAMEKNKKIIIKIFFDILVLSVLGIVLVLVDAFIPRFQRGFFCDDQSLKYSFKENTCGFDLLLILSIGVPIIVIILLEILNCSKSSKAFGLKLEKSLSTFAFGFLTQIILLTVLKKLTGRLRPHFFEVCRPNFKNSHCFKGNYIQSYNCTNSDTDPAILEQHYQSFPSGHASFMFYSMTFLILLTENKLKFQWSILLKTFIQFLCFITAIVVSISRVTDYWHHWSDVVIGGIIGTLFAIWSIYIRFKHSSVITK